MPQRAQFIIKRKLGAATGLFFGLVLALSFSWASDLKGLLLDDFEGEIKADKEATVDFGAGNGSNVSVSASRDIKFCGNQAIKVEYDAVSSGYMWVARGYNIDIKGAACWQVHPKDIDWKNFNAFSFYMYGSNSERFIAFDIKDKGSEMWRFMVKDDFNGWKQIVCPFKEFYARGDWQPSDADKNGILDFPIMSFQFEPRPEGKGTLYFDCVELIRF